MGKEVFEMEIIENKQQSTTTPWSIRLFENDKIRLNNLLEVLPGTDKREKLMGIISKAEVETSKNKASSEFLSQLQQYTTAIIQSATAQATHAANTENLIRSEYEQILAKKLEEIEALQKNIAEREDNIRELTGMLKEQKVKVSDAADKVEEYREKVEALQNDLQIAKSEAVSVAEIRDEYIGRINVAEAALKKAEMAKNKIESEKAAVYAELDNMKKTVDSVTADNAVLNATVDAQNNQIVELKEQLMATTTRAERAESEKMQLFGNFLAVQQQQLQKIKIIKKPAPGKTQALEKNK